MNLIKIKKERFLEIIWFIVVVILFVFSLKLIQSGELESKVASFGIWAPILILVLKMTTLVIAPLGGTPIYVIAGALFGGLNGFLLSLLGDILGSSVCFFLSRRYGQKVLVFLVGSQNVAKILKTVNILSTTKSFIKARIGFMSMPELLSYAAGLSKINFFTFTLINTFFYIPVDFVLVFLGSRLAEFGIKYFWLLPVLVFLVTVSGFLMLYKDYQKAEGM